MLSRDDLLRALASGHDGLRVGDAMTRDCEAVHPGDMLDAVFTHMQAASCNALPVVSGHELVGIVTLENIGEWMMIHASLARARG